MRNESIFCLALIKSIYIFELRRLQIQVFNDIDSDRRRTKLICTWFFLGRNFCEIVGILIFQLKKKKRIILVNVPVAMGSDSTILKLKWTEAKYSISPLPLLIGLKLCCSKYQTHQHLSFSCPFQLDCLRVSIQPRPVSFSCQNRVIQNPVQFSMFNIHYFWHIGSQWSL